MNNHEIIEKLKDIITDGELERTHPLLSPSATVADVFLSDTRDAD